MTCSSLPQAPLRCRPQLHPRALTARPWHPVVAAPQASRDRFGGGPARHDISHRTATTRRRRTRPRSHATTRLALAPRKTSRAELRWFRAPRPLATAVGSVSTLETGSDFPLGPNHAFSTGLFNRAKAPSMPSGSRRCCQCAWRTISQAGLRASDVFDCKLSSPSTPSSAASTPSRSNRGTSKSPIRWGPRRFGRTNAASGFASAA